MKITIKKLYQLSGSPFVMDPTITYPEIEGDTSNFLEDYDDHKEEFDNYFVKKYGERFVDLDAETESDALEEFQDMLVSILHVYLSSWASLYYALNIPYNPIFNVEEHTTTTYGAHETETNYGIDLSTDSYGQKQRTDAYGAKSHTEGSREDNSTSYSVSFDAAIEKETGKVTDSVGSQTSSDLAYSDTHTDAAVSDTHTRNARKDSDLSKQHIDQIDRSGNIGTVSATDLLIREEQFRRNYAFFKNCFLTIIEEVGAYYEYDALF